mgnify:CR=1 FL=1
MKNFPELFKELNVWMEKLGMAAPEVMKGFGSLHAASLKSGALETKTKELIALGIAITARCEGCIAYHVHDAMKAGACNVDVLKSEDKWFGVTYKEDKETVVNAIRSMKEEGIYPKNLWK